MKLISRAAILILILLMSLFSCTDTIEEATVDLNFTLSYQDEPLVAFEERDYPLGFKVFFTKYSLYISDVELTSIEGNHKLSDVEFLDLLTGVNDDATAEEGQIRTYLNVPARQYDGLTFNIGVPSEVNATEPASYNPDSPLSNNGEYWVGWSSYIFHKIEGKFDSDGDGDAEAGLALHIGSDMAFREVRISAPINIDQEKEVINVQFDLAENLNIDGTFFDIQATPQIHHLGVLPKALPILDNTAKKIVVTER